ncbi:unnamed protein product [Clonostachys rosea]|uniref:Protein kinase domain-containing protein n=1 Tax=Bionectria ochroleuca TaxID=29856 RepID=A0ABY6UJR9_BIOOC|nr:unnamed protein product [Clonostachys rosea]
MPKKPRSAQIPVQLPPCEGPKLKLFEHHNCEIAWGPRLEGDGGDGSSTKQGYAFRVRIKGKDYAIKVFKFYDPMAKKHIWGPLIGRDTPLNIVSYYNDPFYNECRAYGRIHEAAKSKRYKSRVTDAAVTCHGFMFLGVKDQKILEDLGIDLELDKVDPLYQQGTAGGFKPRAIVKELASNEPGVGGEGLKKVLDRIVTLNGQRIYNEDIHLNNFRDGRLVDFGSSWTEPHRMLDAQKTEKAYGTRIADRLMFDEMVEKDKISNPDKILAVHPMKLHLRRRK